MITSSDGLLGRVESHEQLGVVCGAVQEGAKTANSCLVAGGGCREESSHPLLLLCEVLLCYVTLTCCHTIVVSWRQCLGSVDVVAPGVVIRKTGSWVRAALPGRTERTFHHPHGGKCFLHLSSCCHAVT